MIPPPTGVAPIDSSVLIDAISASGGSIPGRAYPSLRQRDFGLNFAQRIAGNDVRYVSELLGAAHRPRPLGERLQSIHDDATAAGFGDNDVKALLLY